MGKKLRKFSSLFGLLTGIIMGLVPILALVVKIPGEITVLLLKAGVVFFIITMALLLVSMLLAPNIIVKLTVLPVTYAIIVTGYMVYKMNAHSFFLQAILQNGEEIYTGMAEDVSMVELSMLLHGGTIVMCIPLVIASVMKFHKLTKRSKIDFTTYNRAKGMIKNIEDTRQKVNGIKVYQITIEIPYYQGEAYEVCKSFAIPTHVLNAIPLYSEVNLRIQPDRREEVYIESAYGIL